MKNIFDGKKPNTVSAEFISGDDARALLEDCGAREGLSTIIVFKKDKSSAEGIYGGLFPSGIQVGSEFINYMDINTIGIKRS